jgi:membrane protein involved in colicin uptake
MAEDDKPDPKLDEKPDPSSDDTPEEKPVDHAAEAAKWRAMSRKHEAEAKRNAEAAKKLKEIEDQDKSESQKANDRADAEKRRADEAEERALRLEVAHDKGLTAAQAKRLVGSTREELEADADALLEEFGDGSSSKGNGKPPARKPKERLKGGTDPEDGPDETDVSKIVEKVRRY